LSEIPELVVDTLEPSWAVVFPRFSAVVAELGGELGHASILLREAGIPAVVNARGTYRAIADGDLVRVDPAWGEVRVEARRGGDSPKRSSGRAIRGPRRTPSRR
jgi:phosphoenolpyruvate-protein kinase (PTS system EI component)